MSNSKVEMKGNALSSTMMEVIEDISEKKSIKIKDVKKKR